MKKKTWFYCLMMLLAVCLFALSMTVLGGTRLAGPIVLVLGVYLLVGAAIRLCKLHEKFENFLTDALTLLFWLP